MSYPQKIVKQVFSRLELEVRHVEVMEYATKDHVHILIYELSNFDTDFRVNYRTKYQPRKIPIFHLFLTSLEHYHITEYT